MSKNIYISDGFSHKYVKIKINSDNGLPSEKALNMYNAVIFIMLAFNKNYNHYYY